MAIAEQEEYIKRQRSCLGILGHAHDYRPFVSPSTGASWSQCFTCDVTETRESFLTKSNYPPDWA